MQPLLFFASSRLAPRSLSLGVAASRINRRAMSTNAVSVLKDVDWLVKNHKGVIPVDASWHMPNASRNALKEYQERHIPNARFFSIDDIADRSTGHPHLPPTVGVFEEGVGNLGISNKDDLIFYDTVGLFSAARAYWLFQLFGHQGNLYILDGGFPSWLGRNAEVASGTPDIKKATYKANFNPSLIRNYDEVSKNGQRDHGVTGFQVVDARPSGRFTGKDPEPRPNLPSGHMPQSVNIPFNALLQTAEDKSTRLLPIAQLQAKFAEANVDLSKPIVTSCGSGVTACVVYLAAQILGSKDVSVYAGSWAEYGARPESKIVKST